MKRINQLEAALRDTEQRFAKIAKLAAEARK